MHHMHNGSTTGHIWYPQQLNKVYKKCWRQKNVEKCRYKRTLDSRTWSLTVGTGPGKINSHHSLLQSLRSQLSEIKASLHQEEHQLINRTLAKTTHNKKSKKKHLTLWVGLCDMKKKKKTLSISQFIKLTESHKRQKTKYILPMCHSDWWILYLFLNS